MSNTPQHDKILSLNGENQIVGEFVDWLLGKYVLGRYEPCNSFGDEILRPSFIGADQLLADYFGIDLKALEAEKREILCKIRTQTQTKTENHSMPSEKS